MKIFIFIKASKMTSNGVLVKSTFLLPKDTHIFNDIILSVNFYQKGK